jgi:hypothetical protein
MDHISCSWAKLVPFNCQAIASTETRELGNEPRPSVNLDVPFVRLSDRPREECPADNGRYCPKQCGYGHREAIEGATLVWGLFARIAYHSQVIRRNV